VLTSLRHAQSTLRVVHYHSLVHLVVSGDILVGLALLVLFMLSPIVVLSEGFESV
jgi:hypothetical protein